MTSWSVCYKRAILDDGSLLFPEKLSYEFLDSARRSMGTDIFNGQYMNQVMSDESRRFKKEWISYYQTLPSETNTFAFIDPAIGQKETNDFTGVVVIDVDVDGKWFVRVANRYRLTPTEIIDKIFEINHQFKPSCIGLETQAYQEALMYMLYDEMRKRNVIAPVTGIKQTNQSKESRILGLVPRFEWGMIQLRPGLNDFEDELSSFPKGAHDDILDALASIQQIEFKPTHDNTKEDLSGRPNDPGYESWYRKNLATQSKASGSYGSGEGSSYEEDGD